MKTKIENRGFPKRKSSVEVKSQTPGFVGAEECLRAVFPDENARPSLRWLRRMQAKRLIPFRKVGGRLVFFDVEEVKTAIDRNFRVNAIGE